MHRSGRARNAAHENLLVVTTTINIGQYLAGQPKLGGRYPDRGRVCAVQDGGMVGGLNREIGQTVQVRFPFGFWLPLH